LRSDALAEYEGLREKIEKDDEDRKRRGALEGDRLGEEEAKVQEKMSMDAAAR